MQTHMFKYGPKDSKPEADLGFRAWEFLRFWAFGLGALQSFVLSVFCGAKEQILQGLEFGVYKGLGVVGVQGF